MFSFGSGVLIGTPAGANKTPVNFGLIQSCNIDITGNNKPLYGQYQFPVAIGAGTKKVTGKAVSARISGLLMASLFFGATLTPGQVATAFGEAGSVPASSTYTITVSNSAHFQDDQGVVYAATGLPLVRVASLTAVGQYTVSAGVYTFYSGDASASVLINYRYTISGSGQNFSIPNNLLGPTINFGINLYTVDPSTGLSMTLNVPNCVMNKGSFSTKLEDWLMPEFDFDIFANAAGSVGTWSLPDTF